MNKNILVIDDDTRLRELLKKFLTENGFLVVAADSAAKARELLQYLVFDLIVLDVMMPVENGTEFLAKLRATNQTPVLMLTAMAESQHRITGLELGADDYLAKPFEPKELILRINAILKRTKTTNKPAHTNLTTAEENLFNMLLAKRGEPISRAEIAKQSNIEERAVDVQITRLRKKLENPNQIVTVRGKGYKINV